MSTTHRQGPEPKDAPHCIKPDRIDVASGHSNGNKPRTDPNGDQLYGS